MRTAATAVGLTGGRGVRARTAVIRGAGTSAIVLTIALMSAGPVASQPFPSRPIEIVNSFAPGGTADLNVRALQAGAEKVLGQPLVQVFKQGGGGIVGTTEVANAPADGYKILVVSPGELTAGPNLAKTSYTLDSFAFIGRVSSRPYGFVVRTDAPWRDFDEFRRSAVQQPGKHTIGTTPQGGVFLTAQHLVRRGGMELVPVPYGGSGPYLTAVLGGHVDAAWAPLTSAESYLRTGQMRLLAVTGPARVTGYPGRSHIQGARYRLALSALDRCRGAQGYPTGSARVPARGASSDRRTQLTCRLPRSWASRLRMPCRGVRTTGARGGQDLPRAREGARAHVQVKNMETMVMRFVAVPILMGVTALAGAQTFPTKPIELVNVFAPGGANDLNARALQVAAERVIGQPLVQTFKQGGGGIVGAAEVASATPDGYKLLLVSSGELTAGPNLTKTSYSVDSFAFIARLSSRPYRWW